MEKTYADKLREEWLNVEADLELGKSIKKYQPMIRNRMKELFDLGYFAQTVIGNEELSTTLADLLVRYIYLDSTIEDEQK